MDEWRAEDCERAEGARVRAASPFRLLPWSGDDGKPCYLSASGADGCVARLADDMEAVQLNMGAELLCHSAHMLDEPTASPGEFRFLATRLGEALTDALRIAESRGARLAAGEGREDLP